MMNDANPTFFTPPTLYFISFKSNKFNPHILMHVGFEMHYVNYPG